MKNVYLFRKTEEVSKVLNSTYDTFLKAIKKDLFNTRGITNSDEISKLHDLLALLRLGVIDIRECEDNMGKIILFEVTQSINS